MTIDPQEKDPKLNKIIRAAEREARENLMEMYGDLSGQAGFCHTLWDEQKRILKEKYGIEWKTPREMNPGILYD